MFQLAYPSCKAIGTVLLQTAPVRGLSAGRMESFLRAMREVSYDICPLMSDRSLTWLFVRAVRHCIRLNGIHKSCISRHRISGSSHLQWEHHSHWW